PLGAATGNAIVTVWPGESDCRSAATDEALSRSTRRPQRRQNRCAVRAYSARSSSARSVIEPTVERDERIPPPCRLASAGGRGSTRSTSGRAIRDKNWRAYGEKVST